MDVVGVDVEVEGGGSWADGPTDDECMRPCRGREARRPVPQEEIGEK